MEKLAFVLGAGGARGIAHIGFLQAMDEFGIKPDLIAGCSMGSIVGACYAKGYTPEELQEAVAEHKSGCDGEPSVYVGTYGKYNDGSLCGLWIDLSSFDDYDDFINFCKVTTSSSTFSSLPSRISFATQVLI